MFLFIKKHKHSKRDRYNFYTTFLHDHHHVSYIWVRFYFMYDVIFGSVLDIKMKHYEEQET